MIKFDFNRGMENNKTRVFVMVLIAIAVLSVIGILVFNKNHNKVGIIETNIPTVAPQQTKDSTHTEINMRDNNGTMNIK